jgi:oligopeptide/dipeptide ABC transporter ATP-binding protein
MSTALTDEPGTTTPASGAEPVLSVRDLVQNFRIERRGTVKGGNLHAVDGVSFDLAVKETIGIVGETGCGKTSLARGIAQMPPPTSGEVIVQGHNIVGMKGHDLRDARRHLQMVFQDPYSSLDPKWHILSLVAEPLSVHKIGNKASREKRARELLDCVGLDPNLVGNRLPREVSGGQCQRVAIARALSLQPEVLILDESVSSLDVSVQAQVINLLEDLRQQFNLAYLFIAHDLNVVKHVSDRVAVMYLGKFCEFAPADELYGQPHHPYTVALMMSIPGRLASEGLSAQSIEALGEMPSPLDPPSGCRFRTRCPYAQDLCAEVEPQMTELEPGRYVACHFPLNTSVTMGATSRGDSTVSA